jgi:hypothetical protein
MKSQYTAVLIVGILVFLAGSVFALQGDGLIQGSSMTGKSFWIYAGVGTAALGIVIAFLGVFVGARATPLKQTV